LTIDAGSGDQNQIVARPEPDADAAQGFSQSSLNLVSQAGFPEDPSARQNAKAVNGGRPEQNSQRDKATAYKLAFL